MEKSMVEGQIVKSEVKVQNSEVADKKKKVVTPTDEEHEAVMFKIVNDHALEMKKVREKKAVEKEYEDMRAQVDAYNKEKIIKREQTYKMIKNIFVALCAALLMWVFVSWINVVSHNNQANGYDLLWGWNFFKVFFK